jgi:hypothetical protein
MPSSTSPPQYLYKYYSDHDLDFPIISHLDDYKNRKEALVKPYLYCSLSADFNDPFEFQNKITPLRTKTEILSYFQGNGSSDKELKQLSGNLECGGRAVIEKWTADINQRSMDVTQAKVRVCCFSKRYNSILMWSHYAKKHQGYCLKFNTRKLDLNGRLRKVIYRKKDKYPAVRPIDVANGNMADVISRLLAVKHHGWKYEKEWRLLTHETAITYDRKAVEQVLLGVKASHRLEAELKFHFPEAEFLRAKLSTDRFRLQFDRCS